MTPVPPYWNHLPTEEDFEEAKALLASDDTDALAEFASRNVDERAERAVAEARSDANGCPDLPVHVQLALRCGDLVLALESIRDNSRDPGAVSIATAALGGEAAMPDDDFAAAVERGARALWAAEETLPFDPAHAKWHRDLARVVLEGSLAEVAFSKGCPDDPICQTCDAAGEDDVCLPHEREAEEIRQEFPRDTPNPIWGIRYYACGCRVPDPAVSEVTASGPCRDPSRHVELPQANTHTTSERTGRLYGCAKRGCDAVNPDYLSFGTREGKGYCLHHIPIRSRLRLWWQKRRAA